MKIFTILFAIFAYCSLTAQHLPLQIGNQWHYEYVVGWSNYAAIVVDTVTINDKVYFEIERRHYNTGVLLDTTYDRIEGDSAYYRIRNGEERLIINFNWPDGYTEVVQTDSNCINITVLNKGMMNFWGFNTEVFDFWFGFWCTGMEDTAWVLTPYKITRLFGSYWAGDGFLRGAIINGTTYGTLHPLPVELVSFNSTVNVNNITLTWATVTETNNQGFSIERKSNTEDWQSIGFVEGNGTTTETNYYSFTDEGVHQGKYKYRLKQIDFDGSFEYLKEIEVEINFPEVFYLHQNYPNPFNPVTKIKFSIPQTDSPLPGGARGGLVTLKVYDILGREIKTLINEAKQPGNYEVELNAERLPSGVYYYQLKSVSLIETKKMVVIK